MDQHKLKFETATTVVFHMYHKLLLRFFMLTNTEIYFISWNEILKPETICGMEKLVFQLEICLIIYSVKL